jgi:hypothetical protein
MWEMIAAIAVSLGKMFDLGNKLVPPDVIRIDNHEIEKPRLEDSELIRRYNKQYTRLKDHWEIDIASDTNAIFVNMNDEQRALMIENLTNRIFAYRSRHKIIFRKFLATNLYKEWLANQNSK